MKTSTQLKGIGTQPFYSEERDIFRGALKKTVEKRHTSEQVNDAVAVIERIFGSPIMIDLWTRYRKKYIYAANVTWEMAVNSLRGL